MKKTFTLKRKQRHFDINDDAILCVDAVCRLFEVPRSAQNLEVTLNTRKTSGYLEVGMIGPFSCFYVSHNSGRRVYISTHFNADCILRNFIKAAGGDIFEDTAYMTVVYW